MKKNIIQLFKVTHDGRKFGSSKKGNVKVMFEAVKEFLKQRYQLFKTETNLIVFNTRLVALITCLIGIVATYWSYKNGTILSFGDAEAHLNLAKKVVSSLTPSFTQIGSVWLPFPHILMIPFVWNDFLWRSGLAGSIISVVAFIWSSAILYRIAHYLTKSYIASYIAPLVFVFNPNTLYLATTPMTEILLFALVASSLYFFIRWINEDNLAFLVLTAIFCFCASLTRYDGWFLIAFELVMVWIITYLKKHSFKKAEGLSILYVQPAFLGIVLWLLWNKIIFGDFLYFLNGEYSSFTQQMWFYSHGYLPTYHNLFLSFIYYLTDTWLVLGSIVTLLSVIGFVIFVFARIKKPFNIYNLAPIFLFFPLGFYTVSLFTGQASMILPVFAKPSYEYTLSNVRYGVQMLLPAAIFISFLASKIKRLLILLIVILVISQGTYLIYTRNVIVYEDGTNGLSSQKVSRGPDAIPLDKWISKNYDDGLVLMDDYRRPISIVSSNIPMENLIGVGNKPYWQESLDDPTKYAKWVILQKAETDAVWSGLKNKQLLEDHYANVFRSADFYVYKKRVADNNFIKKSGQELILNDKPFTFNGVNIYNLPTLPRSEIDSQLLAVQKYGIKIIRIWAFNNEGKLSDEDFLNFDYILNQSNKLGIRLIVVFGNQWEDYGGPSKFVNDSTKISTEVFYTEDKIKDEFKKYIEKIVLRKNTSSGIEYRNDPSIMSWEILNEPRYNNDKESHYISGWVEDMGHFILNLDSNHLISVGIEGFINKEGGLPYYQNYGSDFEEICKLSVIDICTAHLYPKYLDSSNMNKGMEEIISQWKDISEKYHKPLYLGEVGYDLNVAKPKDKYEFRQDFISEVASIVDRKNLSGALLWNLDTKSDNYYSLSPENPEDDKLISDWVKKIGNGYSKLH